jgi:hypothetical protein
MWNKILQHAVTALISGSLVFAFTMSGYVQRITVNSTDIGYLKVADARLEAQLKTDREETNARILVMAKMVTEQMNQVNLLIAAIKAKNNL